MRSSIRRAALSWFGAAVFCSSVALGQTQEGIAQVRFNKGRELFVKDQFAPALVEFRAAGDLYESPNTRLYIARCERALGHVAAAYVEFQRAASEAADRARSDPRYVSTRDAARQEAADLESKLAHATLLAPNGLPDSATITMNGAAVGAASIGVIAPIDPGLIEIVVKAPGYVTLRKSSRAAAGESVEFRVQLDKDTTASAEVTAHPTEAVVKPDASNRTTDEETPPTTRDETPHASHGLRNAGFVVGGIGIAGMGVFAAFAGLAQNRFDQLKTQCNGGPCDPSYNSQIDEGQTFQLVANVALAAGGALIVTGAIMIIAGISTGSPSSALGAGAVQAAFVPLPGGGWMAGVGRAF